MLRSEGLLIIAYTAKTRRRKWLYLTVLVVASAYPVFGNMFLSSGALERIISHKPEKLTLKWANAWTLLPGQVNVKGLHLDIKNKKHRIQLDIDEAVVELSLLELIHRTLDIHSAKIEGLTFALTRRTTPPGSDTMSVPGSSSTVRAGTGSVPRSNTTTGTKKERPPWVVQMRNTSANGLRSVQLEKLKLSGEGTLRDYAMRLVTKGGPLRIDGLKLDMQIDTSTDPHNLQAKYAQLHVDMELAENVPKQNKGVKLLKFISGRFAIQGDASGLAVLNALLGDKYKLNMSGGGALDVLAILEYGELMEGSRINFNSRKFETKFLNFSATGSGEIVGGVGVSDAQPASLKIDIRDFELSRQGIPTPYMGGTDLFVELSGSRFLLHQGVQDAQLSVDFHDARVRDLTHYNVFIPEQANVEIISGSGKLQGTMNIVGDDARANLNLTGTDIVLDVKSNRLSTDLQLIANLADGSYSNKTYKVCGTAFRMERTQLIRNERATRSGWWGEVKITKGDLIWSQPMDIDAEMRVRMRDTEPLIALLRNSDKRKNVLDKILTVRNLEGTLGIRTNENNILLDPILISGKGLEVMSKLDVLKNSIDGVVYAKLLGIPVNFEIKNNKAILKGLGGKKRVEKQLNLSNSGGGNSSGKRERSSCDED